MISKSITAFASRVTFGLTLLAATIIGNARGAPPSTGQSSTGQSSPGPTYTNPLNATLADPDVIRVGETYYLYATSLTSLGYYCWTSPDLVHWTRVEDPCFARDHDTWGEDLFWAPCVISQGGKYYMYYSCRGPVGGDRKSIRICAAVSDSPAGPFKEVAAPLFDIGKATIDAQVFIDADGKAYLYYSLDISENGKSETFVLPLAENLTSIAPNAKPSLCVTPSQKWEGTGWNEAPYVLKWKDRYILFYSARVFSDPLYAVGYATASSPLGPWEKSTENPILKRTGRVSGPGHNTVALSPDGKEMFIVYHTHIRLDGGGDRELSIDRMTISESGGKISVKVAGPTRTPQPMPSCAK